MVAAWLKIATLVLKASPASKKQQSRSRKFGQGVKWRICSLAA
jgi:hypothetical protein